MVLVAFLGFALALALVVVALSWTVEAVLRRRIGIYLGYAALFVVVFLILSSAYDEGYKQAKECGLFEKLIPTEREKLAPEELAMFGMICSGWMSLLWLVVSFFFTFVTMPLVLVSQIKLKKWSQSRGAQSEGIRV